MMSKQIDILSRCGRAIAFLLIFLVAASCGKGESKGPASAGAPSDSTFSLPLPKGLSAPLPGSDLTLTAKAIIDPGTPGARTVDLEVDPENRQVGGVIDGVTAGPHSIEVQYFLNGVKVAIAALNVEVTPGQNTTVTISETLVHYIEAVSDALFIADNSTQSIMIFDNYAKHPGGAVSLPTPDRMLQGPNTGLSGLSQGGLFVDVIGGGLYVANDAPGAEPDSVRIWDKAAAADGDTKPDRVLTGLKTLLNQPSGIAVDPFRNRMYVVNHNGELLIWDTALSLDGETSPAATVSGPLSELVAGHHPIVLDIETDTLYIGNGNHILVFQEMAKLTGDHQDIGPNRRIRIEGKDVVQVGVALDPNRDLLYLSSLDKAGTLYQITTIPTVNTNVAPVATLSGVETDLNQALALTVSGNTLMAVNQGESEIQIWHHADEKKDNASPTQSLALPPAARPISLFYIATNNFQENPDAPAVTIQKGGNGHGRVISASPGINCGTTCSAPFATESIVTLTAAAEGDSTFIGWDGACTGTGSCTVTMDGPKTVIANFTLNPNALSVSKPASGRGVVTSNPAGIDCGNDCGETYNANTQVTLTAAVNPDSLFTGWGGACSGTSVTCSVTMDAAKSVLANFVLRPVLTVTKTGTGNGTVASNTGGGINCGSDCTEAYGNLITNITLTATANGTSFFAGWEGACTNLTGTCVVTMNLAKTVTAKFTSRPVLDVTKLGTGTGTVTSAPAGIDCGADCTQSYTNLTTQVVLTAGAAANSDFIAWTGCDSTNGVSCTILMSASKVVTARFNLKPVLTITRSGTGSGTVKSSPAGIDCGADCSEAYAIASPPTTVFLTVTPSPDSDFSGWTGGCSGGATTCSVSMDVAKSVNASFTLKPVLTVNKTGNGTVTSTPPGISCGTDCSQPYDVNTSVTLTATAAADSDFTSWTGCSSTNGTSCAVTMDAAKTVTAAFTLKTFPLTVNKTGNGTVTSNPAGINCGTDCSQSYDINTLVTLTAAPAADSNFTSWTGCDTTNGTACTVTMTAAKTVAATFTLKTYTLTVNKTGNGTVTSNPTGINCGTDCSESYTHGTSVTLTATPDTSSNFTGWSGACTNGTGDCVVTMDAAKTVTATFVLKTFTLTVNRTGNGSVSSTPAGITCPTDCTEPYNINTSVTLTATPAADSDFSTWSGCNSSTGTSCTVSMSAAKTVTATFTIKTFALTVTKAGTGDGTVTSSPNGIDCGTDCSESYNIGTSVSLTAVPSTTSDFTGWSGACSGTGSCDVTMDGAKSVVATFALKTFQLNVTKSGTGNGTVTSSPAGIDCGTDCSESYTHGTSVTLTATPNASSIFTGWSGACTNATGTCVITMDASKSVTATFTIKPVLTVTKAGNGAGTVISSPAGIDCGSDCSEQYNNLTTVVSLTATPQAGSVFAGWSGNGDCTDGSLTMNSSKSCTATFTLEIFSLTVTKAGSGAGAGTVTSSPAGIDCGSDCSESYTHGTPVTLTATPDASSNFTGWSGACTNITGNCVVTMDAARTVTATFTLKTFQLDVTKSGNGGGTVTGPGIDCGSDCSEVYNANSSITLTATPDTDSIFEGWSGACSGTGSCDVTMNSPQTVSARFTPKTFNLNVTKSGSGSGTVTSSPAGIDCGSDCDEVYTIHQQVELTAAADTSSQFSGWKGCDNTPTIIDPCVVNMESVRFVEATFDGIVPPLP